jgi:hypothetical protein
MMLNPCQCRYRAVLQEDQEEAGLEMDENVLLREVYVYIWLSFAGNCSMMNLFLRCWILCFCYVMMFSCVC